MSDFAGRSASDFEWTLNFELVLSLARTLSLGSGMSAEHSTDSVLVLLMTLPERAAGLILSRVPALLPVLLARAWYSE